MQASRRALPLYGRAKRGAAEATVRGAKSGEALREILPALFGAAEPSAFPSQKSPPEPEKT